MFADPAGPSRREAAEATPVWLAGGAAGMLLTRSHAAPWLVELAFGGAMATAGGGLRWFEAR
jgi:hypothetical protein